MIAKASSVHHARFPERHGEHVFELEALPPGELQRLLRAALVVPDQRFAETGLRALSFLAAVTQPEGVFLPIGNRGWYARGAARALYDQQPIEACAMVDAWLAAHELTREERYRRAARAGGRQATALQLQRIPTPSLADSQLRRGDARCRPRGGCRGLPCPDADISAAASPR